MPVPRVGRFEGLLYEGAADQPVSACLKDGEVELRDPDHLWVMTTHEVRETIESELDVGYGKNLTFKGIGPASESEVRFGRMGVALRESC